MTDLTKQQIDDFAECMIAEPFSYFKSNLDAGLTYFGQLIVHDIVPETNPSGSHPPRVVTPALNLDSFYGVDPENSEYINPKGLFYVEAFDFNRAAAVGKIIQRKAKIPEHRNDKNIITAQLQVIWLHFHNYLIKNNLVANVLEAREIVTLVFQLVVIEDFLRDLLKAEVFEYYFRKNGRYTMDSFEIDDASAPIPDLFSKASFRFGHSMPRDFYELQQQEVPSLDFKPIALIDLFLPQQKIPTEMKIDWSMFFSQPNSGINSHAQKGFAIDSCITNSMGVAKHIVSLNLQADMKAKLDTGHMMATQVIKGMPSSFKNPVQLINQTNYQSSKFFKVIDKVEDLPLWPYLLLEAELQSTILKRTNCPGCHGGRYLGGLGSVLNASVLKRSIMVSKFSVFKNGQYDVESALNNLGKFGKKLTAQGIKRLSMSLIINLVKGSELS